MRYALADLLVVTAIIAFTTATLGLAAGGLATAIRVATSGWLAAKRKPLGCPLCMSWWCSLAFTLGGSLALTLGGADVAMPLPIGLLIVLVVLFGATGLGAWLGSVALPPPWIPPEPDAPEREAAQVNAALAGFSHNAAPPPETFLG